MIIPTYTALDYLRLCVDSILAFSNGRTQIIIYADGSPPAAADYLAWISRHPQVKTRYEPENVGITRATNRAVRLADREYLYFVNDDMVFAPGFDSNLLKHARPDRVLTGTMIEPDTSGRKAARCHTTRNLGLYHSDFEWWPFLEAVEAVVEDRLEPGINYPFLISRELFDRIGGIDERFTGPGHDPDLFYRIAGAGAEMLRVRDSLCYHFSGRSLRFEGDQETVSEAWIRAETAGMIAFVRKWGEKPNYRYGGVPRPPRRPPDQRGAAAARFRTWLLENYYRRKGQRQLHAARRAGAEAG